MAYFNASITTALSSLLLTGCVMQSVACDQGAAIYVDPVSGLELSFTSYRQELAIMHQFDLTSQAHDIALNGYVVTGGEPLRPIAFVQNNCPEGDVTGEELAACTVWEGVVYGAFDDGSIGLLPSGDEAAVKQVLLPDFAQSFFASQLGEKIPGGDLFEVFDYKECGDS